MPIFLAALVFSAGCSNQNQSVQERTDTSAEDVRREAKEALETAAVYTQEQQQKYQEEIRTQLDEFDNRLEELKAKAESAREEAKVKLNNQSETLEQKREKAAQRLEKLTSSRDEAWAELKDGMDKAMADLQQSYERVLAEFDDQAHSNQSENKQEP